MAGVVLEQAVLDRSAAKTNVPSRFDLGIGKALKGSSGKGAGLLAVKFGLESVRREAGSDGSMRLLGPRGGRHAGEHGHGRDARNRGGLRDRKGARGHRPGPHEKMVASGQVARRGVGGGTMITGPCPTTTWEAPDRRTTVEGAGVQAVGAGASIRGWALAPLPVARRRAAAAKERWAVMRDFPERFCFGRGGSGLREVRRTGRPSRGRACPGRGRPIFCC